MFALFSTEIHLVSVICWHLTKVFPAHLAEPHYVPMIPAHCMSQLFKFPSYLRVLTFHVLTAMFSLPLIVLIFGTPVAYLSPTSRCLTVGTVIVIPGCDRSGIKVFLVFIFMVCLGRVQPDGAHPSPDCLYWSQPKSTITVWLALVTNTWPLTQRVLPPWPLTSSRKTSAKWCCVISTPNWPIGLGDSWRWERLISS